MRLTGLKVPRKTFANDLVSGLVMSVVTVPGALANGLLAGVNPVYGVYSVIAGTSVAALFTSSVIMNVDSTSATAIATGDFVGGGKVGYWIAIVASTLNVLRWFLFIPGVPVWALTMVVLWALVIYRLSASSEYFS